MKKPPCAPPLKWWILVYFVLKVLQEATITFQSLEGLLTLVSHHLEGILKLTSTIASWFCASEIVSEEEADAINLESNVLSEDKKYSIEICIVKDVLADLGSFVVMTMDEIGVDEKAVVIKSLATCSVKLIAGFARIVAERDSRSDAADAMPPVLPHLLVKLRGREFANVIRRQRCRLSMRWNMHDIERIEQDFEGLLGAYQREQPLKEVLDQCSDKTTFDEGWKHVHGRFEYLKKFCGILATAFPGTSTVESDFSIVKWEKDDCQVALTDFSLEGILHTKQFDKLCSIIVP